MCDCSICLIASISATSSSQQCPLDRGNDRKARLWAPFSSLHSPILFELRDGCIYEMNPEARKAVENNHRQSGLAERLRKNKPIDFSVDRIAVGDVTASAFYEKYVANNLPVVIKGAMCDGDWPCLKKWTHDYLKEVVGNTEVRVRVKPQESGTFGNVERLKEGAIQLYDFDHVPFGDVLDSMQSTPPKYYAARLELQEDLPELIPDVLNFYELPLRHAFGCPYKGGIIAYFGPGHQSTPLHYDTLENFVYMVKGSKTFFLFHPEDSEHLSPSPINMGTHYSLTSIDQLLDTSDKCAALNKATRFEVTLNEGDMLYVPICWWHAVKGGPNFNISLNYWFCQSPSKEDYDCYFSYLKEKFEKWLGQLETMDLPGSVLAEGQKSADEMVQDKLRMRKEFKWGD